MHSGFRAGYRIFFPHHPTPCQFCWSDPSKSRWTKRAKAQKTLPGQTMGGEASRRPSPPFSRPTCLKLPELSSVILLQRCLFLTQMLWKLLYPEIKSMSRARKYPSSTFFLIFWIRNLQNATFLPENTGRTFRSLMWHSWPFDCDVFYFDHRRVLTSVIRTGARVLLFLLFIY